MNLKDVFNINSIWTGKQKPVHHVFMVMRHEEDEDGEYVVVENLYSNGRKDISRIFYNNLPLIKERYKEVPEKDFDYNSIGIMETFLSEDIKKMFINYNS